MNLDLMVFYSRDNLPKHSPTEIKIRAYVINLLGYSYIATYGVTLYVLNNDVTYFDRFGV